MPCLGVRRALSRRLPRLALPALAAIASLTTAAPASAAPPALTAAVAPAANVSVRTKTVEVDYATQPQLFTVDCGPDEEVLSGGYSAPDPAVRVVSSYPSNPQGVATPDGARPRSWTVGGVYVGGDGPRPRLDLAATCLAGDAGAASRVAVLTQTSAESAYSLTAGCPTGTARTGGGHALLWPSDGTGFGLAVLRSSYPVARGWRVDVANPPPIEGPLPPTTASVYAVCLASGDLEVAEREPVNVDLVAGQPACDGVNCVAPRSGETTVQCGEGQLFAGAGYQISDPSLSHSVRVATPAAGPVWTVTVFGSTLLPATAQPTPIRMVVRTLCLVAEVPAVSTAGPAPTTQNPALPRPEPSRPELQARSDFSILVGAGLIVLTLLLLLLLLLALLALRRGGRRRLAGSVEVVVRGVRTGYRIGGESR
jgi:hypothetical protein